MAHGAFCWYELMASDLDAAGAFYGDVVGWSCEPSGMDGMDYRLFKMDDARIGGLMSLMGPQPAWTGYVVVDDCDASAAKVQELGGTVYRQPDDIPDVGRFAVLADPQGAMLSIITPFAASAMSDASPDLPGGIGWHELHARDLDAVWPFYAGLFGWEKGEGVKMPNGVYQLFREGGADRDIGGFVSDAQAPQPYWNYYFTVPAVEAGMERVTAGGGTVRHGPYQVPGGAWIAMCVDPQGALFSLTAAER